MKFLKNMELLNRLITDIKRILDCNYKGRIYSAFCFDNYKNIYNICQFAACDYEDLTEGKKYDIINLSKKIILSLLCFSLFGLWLKFVDIHVI